MSTIIFDFIMRMSDEFASPETRDDIARDVLQKYGVNGLVVLWKNQDYYDPTEPLHSGATPATLWWLQKNNAYANMVRTVFQAFSEEEALDVLAHSTFPPNVDFDVWACQNDAHMKECNLDRRDKFSHASCATVRKLANVFFPQYPALEQPHCSLYSETFDAEDEDDYDEVKLYPIHTDPLGAFVESTAALQYLIRTHQGITVRREGASAEVQAMLERSDEEWAIYDAMGLEPMASYLIATNKVKEVDSLQLPVEFDAHPH